MHETKTLLCVYNLSCVRTRHGEIASILTELSVRRHTNVTNVLASRHTTVHVPEWGSLPCFLIMACSAKSAAGGKQGVENVAGAEECGDSSLVLRLLRYYSRIESFDLGSRLLVLSEVG